MASTQDFAEYVLDCISLDETKIRKMFGEFAIYLDNKVVGFICGNTLFLKVTENSTDILGVEGVELKQGQAYPGSKNYYIASEELLENKKVLQKVLWGIWENVEQKKK